MEVTNLLSYRGEIPQSELNSVAKDMQEYIKTQGGTCKGNPITGIYGMKNNNLIDIEVLIPIDKCIPTNELYSLKEKLKIVNAVTVTHTGSPDTLQESCNELNSYIIAHNYQPITIGYNRVETSQGDNNNFYIKVYVGINPNII